MSLRDKILAADDIEIEHVPVPEWDVTVDVKSLTIDEQQRFLDAVRKRGVEGFEVDRKKFAIQLLIRTVIDPDTGKQVLEQADAETLATKSSKPVMRLFEVAANLAGLGDDQVDKTIAELKGTASDDSS